MKPWVKNLSPENQKKLKKKRMPLFIEPMLATLTHDYFNDNQWIFECKFDGERCLAFIDNKQVLLKSRNNKNLNASYPEIVSALQQMNTKQIILDGEMVAFQGHVTSFSKLQARFGLTTQEKETKSNVNVYYYVFDILYYDGYDVTELPLLIRKKILKEAVPFSSPIRYTTHKNTYGIRYHKEACQKKWEGIIAKEKKSTYVHKRSAYWLKFKCVANQELVIGGFTEPHGSRVGFGALLLGYYDTNVLQYAGKVGTGFNEATLKTLYKELKKIQTKECPFNHIPQEKNVHWVKPIIVAEIGFTEWTKSNKLRHPRFQGLRRDKKAKDVAKES